jgi:electron transport complex protein RnfG
VLKIKYFFQQSWLLIVASFFFGLLIAVANATWQERIVKNEEEKFNRIAADIFEQTVEFPEEVPEKVEVDLGKSKRIGTYVKKAMSADGKCVGWTFVCVGSGFADKIKLVLGVDAGFEKLRGFGVLVSNETPGFGDQIKLPYYRNQFVGVPAVKLVLLKMGNPATIDSKIVAISGATVSSEAVVEIINKFVAQVKNHMQAKGLIGNGR